MSVGLKLFEPPSHPFQILHLTCLRQLAHGFAKDLGSRYLERVAVAMPKGWGWNCLVRLH